MTNDTNYNNKNENYHIVQHKQDKTQKVQHETCHRHIVQHNKRFKIEHKIG